MLRPTGRRGEGKGRHCGHRGPQGRQHDFSSPRLTFPPGVASKCHYFRLPPRVVTTEKYTTETEVVFWSRGQSWGALSRKPGREESSCQDSRLSSKIKVSGPLLPGTERTQKPLSADHGVARTEIAPDSAAAARLAAGYPLWDPGRGSLSSRPALKRRSQAAAKPC